MPDMGTLCLEKLIENNFEIVAAVAPHASHPSHRIFCECAKSLNVNCLKFEKSLSQEDFLEQIRALNPDIGVVCSFNKKIPRAMFEIPKMGMINCHPSFLPHYRGGNPYFHVINNNEPYTGITLHKIDENFDTGDIIYREKIAIEPYETMGTLFNRLNYRIADVLLEVLKNIENGQKIRTFPQEEGQYKIAPSFNSDAAIDWKMPAERIERLIRACNPFYACQTTFRGVFFKIFTASYKLKRHNYEAGRVVDVGKNFSVATSDGFLYPKSMQVGSYIVCDAETFTKIFKVQKGEKLG